MSDLLTILENVADLVPLLWPLFSVICFIIGGVLILRGLRHMAAKQYVRDTQNSYTGMVGYIVSGACMIGMPGFLEMLQLTLFGAGVDNDPSAIFAYAPESVGLFESDGAEQMIIAITVIIQFVGAIGVARGILLLNQSANGGQQTFGPGLTFVIAGAMATNFPVFVGLMESLIV